MKKWIQVVNNEVNLIGAEDVGLPLPESYLAKRPHVLQFDFDLYPNVTLGMYYDTNRKEFVNIDEWNIRTNPKLASMTAADLLNKSITAGIEESKKILRYVLNKPMEYNGRLYTVTFDKQKQLSNLLVLYNNKNDNEMTLWWNETGKESTEWSYDDLSNLYVAMINHVTPLIREQQTTEIQIQNATLSGDVGGILFNYQNTLDFIINCND